MSFEPTRIREKIEKSLAESGKCEEELGKNVAFHMTAWLEELIRLGQFYQSPERFTSTEVSELIQNFLTKVPGHLTEASRLFFRDEYRMTKIELINKLLVTGELDSEERKFFEAGGIPITELVLGVQKAMGDNKFFPIDATLWEPGEEVYDGAILERANDGTYRLYIQKARDLDAFMLSESKAYQYDSFELAAEAYIRFTWGKSINGIKINWKGALTV